MDLILVKIKKIKTIDILAKKSYNTNIVTLLLPTN